MRVALVSPYSLTLPGGVQVSGSVLSYAGQPLSVPATALVIRDGPPQVVIADVDSTVHYRTVSIARDHGSWVEVTGGLADGARIVVNPSGDLVEGARVRVVAASTVTRDQ